MREAEDEGLERERVDDSGRRSQPAEQGSAIGDLLHRRVGERKGEGNNGETAQRTERYVGTFRRSIALPTRVDANKVSATYQDGILKVTLPKAEEAKPKQIQVS